MTTPAAYLAHYPLSAALKAHAAGEPLPRWELHPVDVEAARPWADMLHTLRRIRPAVAFPGRADTVDDADKIADVAKTVLEGKVDPAAARVAIDAFKWSAGKRRPKRYGEKLEIEQTGSVQVTHTLDVSNLTLEELDVLERVLGGSDE